jgi:hypothetical protein
MTRESYRPRTESPLNPNLNRRLLAYATAASAAGVGLLALVKPAEAKVVYTRVNKPLNYGVTILDLNNDGTPDFEFCRDDTGSSRSTTCVPPGHRAAKRRLGKHPPFDQVLYIFPPAAESKNNQIWANGSEAYALPAGVVVGGKTKFAPGAKRMANCYEATSSTCGGPWSTAPHRYLALKFVIGGKIHYGWARLKVTWKVTGGKRGLYVYDAVESATLTGYAYETVPKKSIVTGDIVGPSKRKNVSQKAAKADGVAAARTLDRAPASLGLLAMGAEGMVAWRKKNEGD